MGIGSYIRRIGRKRGDGRGLSRTEAADLMRQIFNGSATDLEVGAFCMAMRIKGETSDEFVGFLDALAESSITVKSDDSAPVVVIPSYNGARKIPVLTPLLGLLLARQGLPVLIHGMASEDQRVTSGHVLRALGIDASKATDILKPGELRFMETPALSAGLARLLNVRRQLTLRNTGHSLAKMFDPVVGRSLLLSSYTHGEYSDVMQAAFSAHRKSVLLFHGVEGEVITETRRLPETQFICDGAESPVRLLVGPELDLGIDSGRGLHLPVDLVDLSAAGTAAYIRRILNGEQEAPREIWAQVQLVIKALQMLTVPYRPAESVG